MIGAADLDLDHLEEEIRLNEASWREHLEECNEVVCPGGHPNEPGIVIATGEAKELIAAARERDVYYNRFAGLLFSGHLDNLTGNDVRAMAEDAEKTLADAHRTAETATRHMNEALKLVDIVKGQRDEVVAVLRRWMETEDIFPDDVATLILNIDRSVFK